MKKANAAVGVVLACMIFSVVVYAAEQKAAETGKDVYMLKLEGQYQQAIALKENGDYEASLAILQKLLDDNPGLSKYEIARLDTILEQSRDMKESKNGAWQAKAKQVGHRIKLMLNSNSANGDFWVVYAKYSAIIEANRETHITKALKKAFYFKPNNPEAYIVQADYNFYKAREARDEQQPGMMYGISENSGGQRFAMAKDAKTSYEAALAGPLSNARQAYIYRKLGDLEEDMLRNKDIAKKDWEMAVKLAPDSRSGKLAQQRLEI